MTRAAAESCLGGLRIALPETRELDLFARMVTQRGAVALRYPLVGIHDHPDQAAVAAWLEHCVAGRYDDLIFYTGEGLRRLLDAAQRLRRRAAFIDALRRSRKLVRGPKPERVLRELGLRADLHAEAPTTDGLIATLRHLDLAGRSLAVQIYGDVPPPALVAYLNGVRDSVAGVEVAWVAPYVYGDEAETARVLELIDRLAARNLEVIAFTSSAQVDRLFQVARRHRDEQALRTALSGVMVAAVGPVVGATLADRGVAVDVIPERSFFLKPLVRAIEARAAQRGA